MAPSQPPTTRKPTTEEIENRMAQIFASGPLSLLAIADALWPWSKGHEDAITDVFERIGQSLGEGHDALWRVHPTHSSAIAARSNSEKTGNRDAREEKDEMKQRKGSRQLSRLLQREEDGDEQDRASQHLSSTSSTSSLSTLPFSPEALPAQPAHTRSHYPSPISTASLSPPLSNLSRPGASPTSSGLSSPSSSISSTVSTPPPSAELEEVAVEVAQEAKSTTKTATAAITAAKRKAASKSESGSAPSKKKKKTTTTASAIATVITAKPADDSDNDAASTEGENGARTKDKRAPKPDMEQVQCTGITKKNKMRCGFKKMVPVGTVWDCGRHD